MNRISAVISKFLSVFFFVHLRLRIEERKVIEQSNPQAGNELPVVAVSRVFAQVAAAAGDKGRFKLGSEVNTPILQLINYR